VDSSQAETSRLNSKLFARKLALKSTSGYYQTKVLLIFARMILWIAWDLERLTGAILANLSNPGSARIHVLLGGYRGVCGATLRGRTLILHLSFVVVACLYFSLIIVKLYVASLVTHVPDCLARRIHCIVSLSSFRRKCSEPPQIVRKYYE
jgi:hypothetical protein